MSVMTRVSIAACLAGAVFGFSPAISAQVPVPLAERARGAERVVVGRVASVAPHWQVNEFGDRLIVSVLRVAVTETLKGDARRRSTSRSRAARSASSRSTSRIRRPFAPGERAVFFLKRKARGRFVPHLRGQGLLKLDGSNRVPGSSLTLDEIRREVAAGRAR